jgi:coproporphyrinogen III oxidase
MKKKVTLNFDSKVYEKFKKFCDDNAIRLSRRMELEMLRILKDSERGER